MNHVAVQLAKINIVRSADASHERKHKPKTMYGKQSLASHNEPVMQFNSKTTWDRVERRSGKDRREQDMIGVKRIDSRNKNDRRASKLSIQI